MRAWALGFLALLLLASFPAAGLDPSWACGNERDPSALPAPAEGAGLAAAAGYDLALAQALGPAPFPEGYDPLAPLAPGEDHHPCSGKIRPGAALSIAGLGFCTANFVYVDDNNELYIGTAGHCVPNLSFTTISITGIGDIGDPVFTINAGPGNDFALIKIAPQHYGRVDPTMCHWGGPQGLAHARDGGFLLTNELVLQYGWGLGWGTTSVTRARMHFLRSAGWNLNTQTIEFQGFVSGGDSGSGIMTHNGDAMGVVTHTLAVVVPMGLGIGVASPVDYWLDRAGAQMGRTYRVHLSDTPTDLTGLSVPS